MQRSLPELPQDEFECMLAYYLSCANNTRKKDGKGNELVLAAVCKTWMRFILGTITSSTRCRLLAATVILCRVIGVDPPISASALMRRLLGLSKFQIVKQLLVRSDSWRRPLLDAAIDFHGFNQKQAYAYVVALGGANVFLSGGGGVGKSYTATRIMDALGGGERIAPTNVAASLIDGVTLSKFCGSLPVLCSVDDVANPCIMSYHEARHRILKQDEDEPIPPGCVFIPIEENQRNITAKCLMLDEVSMVSECALKGLQAVLERDGLAPQLVFCGDFAQLPPVYKKGTIEHAALRKGVVKQFVFQTEAWSSLNLVEIELDVNMRSRNAEWSSLLAEIRVSRYFSARLVHSIRRLTSSKQENSPFSFMSFRVPNSRGPDAQTANERMYAELDAPERLYAAVDAPVTNARPRFRKLDALLYLKVGASVMVTQGDHFGAIGIVQELLDDSVRLRHGTLVFSVEKELETKTAFQSVAVETSEGLRTVQESVRVERRQLPLKHAFASTFHSSQGMTVHEDVDCHLTGIFSHGQTYVGLSRSSDPSRLRVIGLTAGLDTNTNPDVIKHILCMRGARLPNWAV